MTQVHFLLQTAFAYRSGLGPKQHSHKQKGPFVEAKLKILLVKSHHDFSSGTSRGNGETKAVCVDVCVNDKKKKKKKAFTETEIRACMKACGCA